MSRTPRWRMSPATLTKLQAVAVKLADGTITAEQRSQYQSQASELTNNVQVLHQGRQLQRPERAERATATAVKVITNGSGTYYSFSGYKALTQCLQHHLHRQHLDGGRCLLGADQHRGDRHGHHQHADPAQQFRQLRELHRQPDQLQQVDPGCAAERARRADRYRHGQGIARLQALQIRQQLGTQALGIANQAPQSLVSLFKG